VGRDIKTVFTGFVAGISGHR